VAPVINDDLGDELGRILINANLLTTSYVVVRGKGWTKTSEAQRGKRDLDGPTHSS
jgi:hypothetical protein